MGSTLIGDKGSFGVSCSLKGSKRTRVPGALFTHSLVAFTPLSLRVSPALGGSVTWVVVKIVVPFLGLLNTSAVVHEGPKKGPSF